MSRDARLLSGGTDNRRPTDLAIMDLPASAVTSNLVLASQVRLSYGLPIYLPLVRR